MHQLNRACVQKYRSHPSDNRNFLIKLSYHPKSRASTYNLTNKSHLSLYKTEYKPFSEYLSVLLELVQNSVPVQKPPNFFFSSE